MSNTTEQVLDRAEIRRRLRVVSAEDFQKAHAKTVLVDMATTLGVEDPSGTKAELYQLILDNAGLPDQSVRGSSSIKDPVAQMWLHCDSAFADAISGEGERPRRKDVIASAKEAGIAHHTARTQYQAWFTATARGTRRLADLNPEDLPRSLQPEPEEADEASDES